VQDEVRCREGVLPVPARRGSGLRRINPPGPRVGPLLAELAIQHRRTVPQQRQGRVGDACLRLGP
jgi:hypothetical protein